MNYFWGVAEGVAEGVGVGDQRKLFYRQKKLAILNVWANINC